MTEQSTAQKIDVGLAELVGLMNGPAWPGRQHRTGILVAELAATWNQHRQNELAAKPTHELVAELEAARGQHRRDELYARFATEHADDLADIAAHDDELDQQNALRRGDA